MDLGEILRVIRRRWYLMAPIMALTFLLTALAYFLLPTSYESTSTVSLLSAERASIINKSGNTNPYLTFDSSLVATADFLSRSLSSKGSQQELKKLGVTEEYTAGLADNSQGPFISIVVTGTNKAKVLRSTTALTDFAGKKLTEIQAATGVVPQDMVRLTTIVPPQEPEALIKDKLQLVIAVAAAGTAAAFLVTFVAEGLARSRRAASAAVAPSPQPASPRAEQPASPRAEWPAEPQRSTPADSERTAVIKLPQAQRAAPSPSVEKTQVLTVGNRAGAKSPAEQHRGSAPATVYQSSTANGKQPRGVNGKSQEDGDSAGKR